jgi:Zn-dependent M16 (insulinase) family peptidase
MDGETTSRIDETASVASRLETTENAVFSRDQIQGEDREAYCKELEVKIRDLQTRNDALQRAIGRYEMNSQSKNRVSCREKVQMITTRARSHALTQPVGSL